MRRHAKPDRARISAVTRSLGPSFWETVRQDPRAVIPPYDPITGYRTWAEFKADPPEFTGIYALAQGVGVSQSRG